jgi:hypothetical protein
MKLIQITLTLAFLTLFVKLTIDVVNSNPRIAVDVMCKDLCK